MVTKRKTQEEFLDLLKEAIVSGVQIRPNNRFVFKEKRLGGFLYRIKKTNNTSLLEEVADLGFDYHKAKKNSIRNQIQKEWLTLLKEALKDENVKIQVNHRFKYKGKNLGTFLVEAKRSKKLARRIKKMGLNFDDFRKGDINLYAKRFIKDLWESDISRKPKFITRFYRYILPHKDKYNPKIIEEINEVWKIKFRDRRIWRYPIVEAQKVALWKKWRYDEEKNPKGKWLQSAKRMEDLFSFAYRRKRKIYLMKKIEKYFTSEEIEELKSEGYFDEKYLIH